MSCFWAPHRYLFSQDSTESLAGRFEILRLPHWSLAEMQAAFDFGVEHHLYFGGSPARH